jgi:CubicO group peptidase (beta-lactamase class C family)
LDFTRQTSAVALKKPEAPKYDSGMPPVSVEGMKAVLDRDLAGALQSGQLTPSTGGGLVVGVVQRGVRKVLAYGAAKENSIFEIGSVTKTFTGLILAQMVVQGKVKLDDPVRTYLPDGTVAKAAGAEISLLDLATQHSGLPRMPDNFHPANAEDPYADYAAPNLYEFIAKHGLAKPADAGFNYSNLGFGLLGQALANRSGVTYPVLLRNEVTEPLGLRDTTVNLSPEQQARFVAGHDGQHRPAHAWSLDAMAGAGAIRSTASDMLMYLEAQLHPDAVKAEGPSGSTIARALTLSHELRADAFPGTRIALAWLSNPKDGSYWHNGATGGYSSYVFFNPKEDYAAVVLYNGTIGSDMGSYADRVGEHVAERLAGKPAVMLGP